ncbi:hypothetical protein ACH0CV_14805 [Brachybacterium paraconglomeratum]|uniref:hypothetical protein n=1 Tax=Brachybacterium paraconglomeratum TaxID=173362 RepID=UPI00387999C6
MDDVDPTLCLVSPAACIGADVGGRGKEAIENKVGQALSEPIENLVNGMLDRALDSLIYFMTLWMNTPSASLDESDPVGAAITTLQGYMTTITVFFAVLGILIAAARMAWTARAEPIKEVGAMFLRVLFVQAGALLGTQTLLKAGDEFAPWLVTAASGNDMNHSIVTLMPFISGSAGSFAVYGPFVVTQGIGAMLIIGIILLIVTALQVLFLILRDVLLAILLAFLPTLAAASLFKGGSEGFEKALGWMVALILYKPVAAAIYVLGVLMVTNVAGDQSSAGQEWMALLLGTLTLILAVVAMPSLVKFVAPAAGRGVSNAFSGGAALGAAAGVAATGAAVVAVAGTGGAAAGATGAGAGGAGAGANAGNGALAGAGGAAPTAPATEGAAPSAAAPDGSGKDSSPPAGGTPSGDGKSQPSPESNGGDGSSGASPAGWGERPSGLSVPAGSAPEPSSSGSAPEGSEGSADSGSDAPASPSGAPQQPSNNPSPSGAPAFQAAADQVSDRSDDSGTAVEELTT